MLVNSLEKADMFPCTVVVTGASAGVGRAIAHRFARAGARLGLIARDAEALRELASEIESLGGTAIVGPRTSPMPTRFSGQRI